MTRDDIRDEYFDWLYELVCDGKYAKAISYRKLFEFLHETEFVYSIPRDQNRAEDGIDLRWRFVCDTYIPEYADEILEDLDSPCSVLEMMVALAITCENIMDDPAFGNRTSQWFWEMIVNLGLGGMSDSRFNRLQAEESIVRFLNREYEPDGKGGLFTIDNCDRDLRNVEIWYQLCWYLDSIT